jgi:hypothetical protein
VDVAIRRHRAAALCWEYAVGAKDLKRGSRALHRVGLQCPRALSVGAVVFGRYVFGCTLKESESLREDLGLVSTLSKASGIAKALELIR